MKKFTLSAFADEINKDLKIQMDVLDEHGIEYIEMRGVNGKNITVHTMSEVREIKKEIDERGFKLSAVGSPIGKIKLEDDFEAHLDLLKHTLEIAQVLETKYIRMFSFFMPENTDFSNYKNEVMERLGKFVEATAGSGVMLLHENEKDIYGDIPERCLEIFKAYPQIRATFDPANFVQCGVNVIDAYKMICDYIEYVHIKDAVAESGEVVPAGMGDGCIEEFLTELDKRDFNGFLSLEPHLGDFEGFADLEGGKVVKKEASGPDKFAIAVNALNKILLK